MPGNYQLSPDQIVQECREVADLGIPGVILFGIPSRKDERGSEAYDRQGIIQTVVAIYQRSLPAVARRDGCVSLRVHEPWTLRPGTR